MTMVFDRAGSAEVVARAATVRQSRIDAEAARMAAVLARAAPPEECGPAIIPAPARGVCYAEHQVTMVPNGVDARGMEKWAAAATGYGHRAAVRKGDVFDRIRARSRKGSRGDLLTPGQIAQARRYRDLVEHLAAGSYKLSQLDRASGSSERDFMDARLAVSREVNEMRRRVGSDAMLSVRRMRPDARGSRVTIMDIRIVDLICLGDADPSEVLRKHGWQCNGHGRKAVMVALGRALDRMIGYRR